MLDSDTAQTRIGNYRWVICALLFFATTVNYMDRQVISILRPVLEKELHWANPEQIDIEYGYITTAFTISYAIGVLVFGWFVDKVGTKIGYGVSVGIWGLASLSHALARSSFGLGAARVGLGIGESGNFPSAIKAVAEWFPKKERALAAGIFNSGANIGAVMAPLIIPFAIYYFASSPAETFTLEGHNGNAMSAAFSADGKRIVGGSSDGTLKVWNARSGKETLTLDSQSGNVMSMAVSPDGKQIVSINPDGTLKVWDATIG